MTGNSPSIHEPSPYRGILVLASASALCVILGSIHAFSVFLEPMEQAFDASRSRVSLSYSFALVALTFAVLTGHRTFHRISPPRFVLLVGLMASAGSVVASYASTLEGVWFGYSLLFGSANGLGYGFGLQLAAQANPGREGRSMGIVTASYALGATVAPPLFEWGVSIGGMRIAMLGLAASLLMLAPICALLLKVARARFRQPDQTSGHAKVSRSTLVLLWFGYAAAVFAGLMSIGHATGIAKQSGFTDAVWVAPMVVAICNLVGSLVGGALVDRVSATRLFSSLPLISAFALVVLAASSSRAVTLLGFGGIGFAYGAIIAAYPAMIAKVFGMAESTRIYGKVFTAWGTAGLLAPWFAGYLYDWSGEYVLALGVAAVFGVLSAGAIQILFRTDLKARAGT